MNPARSLTDYLDALATARLALRSPSVLLPFLAFGLVNAALVTLLAFFTAPLFAPFMIPVVRALGGESSLHYPMSFVLLPTTYQTVYLPLAATLGFALWSRAVWLMVDHHDVGRRTPARPFRASLRPVIVVGIVFVAVSVLLGRATAWLAASADGMPGRLILFGGIALTACAQALLVFAPAVLRIRGGNAVSAIRTSARYALRNFGATALVVGTVLIAHLPVDYLLGAADRVALKFHPETVYYLMLASTGLEVLTAYLLFASVVGLALPEEGGLR